MKISLLGVAAVMGCIGVADAASYSRIDMRSEDGSRITIDRGYGYANRTKVRSGKYNRGAYGKAQAKKASYEKSYDEVVYDDFDDAEDYEYDYKQSKSAKKSVLRKYFIASPFYQPLQGRFGSVTGFEFMQGKYSVDTQLYTPGTPGTFGAYSFDRTLTEWSIKEDLSYGITDRITLLGMAQYKNDKAKWEWEYAGATGSDVYKTNGLDLYGIGLQGRIIDSGSWIGLLSGFYEHQKHGVDYGIADLKVGYKVSRTTIYGLARGWLINMEGDVYGDYIDDGARWEMVEYGSAKDDIYMGELGLGVWSVLSQDWTLNVEGMYSFLDWHNQLSVKAAIGWQPNDYFGLNLYAKTSVYDSANDKTLNFHSGVLPVSSNDWQDSLSGADISSFHEWSAGLQVVFEF